MQFTLILAALATSAAAALNGTGTYPSGTGAPTGAPTGSPVPFPGAASSNMMISGSAFGLVAAGALAMAL
ncbi:hypothetical protein K402DRAFT_395605 [Aulographum hederae CBS 113979]|uniref:Uncharacterized protein n=1 Tax=Aulographum hederae CBS 113979 TaxID=1176131 RepID=A0A6G1GUV9_9PEZI|nr:hypothetical protein K402DRAFT_395605 [Aulographum hederae CBS 113979]